jgi:hypothetical protein
MQLHGDFTRAGLDDRSVAVNRVQFGERFAQRKFSIGRLTGDGFTSVERSGQTTAN